MLEVPIIHILDVATVSPVVSHLLTIADRKATLRVLLASRANNTVRQYSARYLVFRSFCVSSGFSFLPCTVPNCFLFFSHLLDTGISRATFTSFFYAVRFVHDLAGLGNPCNNTVMSYLFDAGCRLLAKTPNRRRPVSLSTIRTAFLFHSCASRPLTQFRTECFISVSFFGFFRANETLHLQLKHVSFEDSFVRIFVPKRKNDQFREGHEVLLTKLNESVCPFTLLSTYIKMLSPTSPDCYLFVPLSFSVLTGLHSAKSFSKPLSYSTMLDAVRGYLNEAHVLPDNFGLHSLRAGAASEAAANGVDNRILKKHGGWKSDTARDMYIADSTASRLSVTESFLKQ